MKSNAKSKIIILITLGILFALSSIITTNLSHTGNSNKSSNYSDEINLENENIKISAVSGKIHIANNWTDAKAAEICTGNGTYSEPYVIEDLVIDGGGSGNCILIESSNVYFRIENCTVYNSGSGYHNAGIKLQYVSKGSLINNNASNSNDGDGIYLYFSNDNNISGNIANRNNGSGIYLDWSSNNNTISGNTVNNNDDKGIDIQHGDNNTISGNTANNNHAGIRLFYSDNNDISGNTANNNNGGGISLHNSDNNTISGNTANNNYGGIHLSSSHYNMISGNTANYNNVGIDLYSGTNNNFSGNLMIGCGLDVYGNVEELTSHNVDTTNLVNGKPLYYYTNEVNLGPNDFLNAGQVILVNCSDSLISNLNVSYSTKGISLYYSNNNTISGNNANNNNGSGIHFFSSHYNIISGNTANNSVLGGIRIFDSNNNTISGNTANNNDEGISIFASDDNIVSENAANNNTFSGIYLGWSSNNNTISGNTANYNNDGIYLYKSDDNTISGNIANHNNGSGIYLSSSNNNTISGNILLGNDYCIVEENCQGNRFSDNGTCTYGEGDGGQPIPGYNILFLLGILSIVAIIISKKLEKS